MLTTGSAGNLWIEARGKSNVMIDKFVQQIDAVNHRVAKLEQYINSGGMPQVELVEEAFEELRITLEELHIAEEELIQQNSELAAARASVEAERQRYQELFEEAPDGYIVTDDLGIVQEANHAAAALLNISQKFLIGKPLINYIHNSERPAFRSQLNRLSQLERLQEWEVLLFPRHSAPFDAALTVTIVRNCKGKPVALRWLLRDITERKLAEAQIRTLNAELEQRVSERTAQLEAANQFKDEALCREIAAHTEAEAAREQVTDILESITDAFYALDQSWHFTYLNCEMERILGKQRSDLLGKNIWEEWPEAVGTKLYQEYHLARDQKVTASVEFYYPPLDTWYNVRVYPSKQGLSVYFHNITESKLAEAALVERSRLAALSADISAALATSEPLPVVLQQCASVLVDNFDVAFARIWTLNQEASVLELQASAGLYTNLDGPYSCIPLGKLKLGRIAQTRQRYLTNAVYEEPDITNREWAKSEGMVAFVAYPLIVEDRVVGVMAMFARQPLVENTLNELGSVADGIAQCISRKWAEAELDQLLIREQAARIEAESASRIKDEFLAIVSHELRSPLNAMLGWAKLLRSRKFDEEKTNKALSIIERNAQNQTQLIEDLLDISRIIRGQVRLYARPTNLVQVITAAIDTVRPTADNKTIQVSSWLDPAVGLVSGDPDRLQQVVWNLLSNAIKFTPAGGQVEVRLERVNSYAQVKVSDTGIGISPDFLPYVFERFRQAESTTTRAHGGLGLGLAIVRNLVELHGGTIQVESPGVGQGVTFIVQLPLITDSLEGGDLKQLALQGEASLEASLSLSGLRVLIVDDEIDTREFLLTALEQYGAEVTAAASVDEAHRLLERLKPDVLVSDIGMPVADGYALIREVRAKAPEQGGQIPAAALTAYTREEDRIKALEAGFQTHVPKPIEPTQLVAVVAKLAGRFN